MKVVSTTTTHSENRIIMTWSLYSCLFLFSPRLPWWRECPSLLHSPTLPTPSQVTPASLPTPTLLTPPSLLPLSPLTLTLLTPPWLIPPSPLTLMLLTPSPAPTVPGSAAPSPAPPGMTSAPRTTRSPAAENREWHHNRFINNMSVNLAEKIVRYIKVTA